MYSLEPPHRGSSNEYPQSMFLSRNKKNNVYPCKPQFYYIKVGFTGVKIIQACFRDVPFELIMPTGRFHNKAAHVKPDKAYKLYRHNDRTYLLSVV